MGLLPSWVESANAPDCDFPLNNLALGVFDAGNGPPAAAWPSATGSQDATGLEGAGLLDLGAPLLAHPSWNALMAAGPAIWAAFPRPNDRPVAAGCIKARPGLLPILHPMGGGNAANALHCNGVHRFLRRPPPMPPMSAPCFAGRTNALPANWLHIPIG